MIKFLSKTILLLVIASISSIGLQAQETGLVTDHSQLQQDDVILIQQTASNLYIGSLDINTNHSSACLVPYSIYNEDIQFEIVNFNPENRECQFSVKSTGNADNPYYLHATSSSSWTTVIGEYTYGGLTTWVLHSGTEGKTQIQNSQTSGRYLGSDATSVNSSLYRDKGKNSDELTRTHWKFYKVDELQAEHESELATTTNENPIDITNIAIINNSFESTDLIGWRNDGFQTQNNNAYPGNKDGSYYCEKWVNQGSNLPAAKIHQNLSGLPNGKYEVKLAGGITIQDNNDQAGKGMSLFANYARTPINKIIDTYSVIVAVTNNDLSLGIELNNVNGNYCYFDNLQLVYYGNSLEAYVSTLDPMIEEANKILTAGQFPTALTETLQSAISEAEQAKNSSSVEEVMEAIESLGSVLQQINQSASYYAKLYDYMAEIEQAINHYNRTDLQNYYDVLQEAYNNQSWDAAKIDEEIAKKDDLFFNIELEPAQAQERTIKQRFDVELVEASFPVVFSQTVAGDNHYISYYDQNKNFCIGYRKLNENSFNKTILNSKIAWDSHNFTEMIVDNEGYIHVSGNMHNVRLNYWRSKNPYDASEFEAIHRMTGTEEDNTTYPHFLRTNAGDILFHYRYGWSGNGYEVYNKWNPDTKTWSRFLDKPLIDGQGQRNAYMKGPYYEADGYYHLYWVWRETPDAASNHTFSYARSKDLINWESAAGEAVNSPITFGEKRLAVDPSTITYGTGTLNNVPSHTLDSQNRIVLSNMKYDELGNSQLYVYRLKEDNTWEEKCITNWIYRFQFGGGGSIIFEININGMRNLGNGELGLSYYHIKYGEGEIIFDEETLEPIEIREFAKTYPVELDEVTTTGTYSKPMEARMNQLGNYIFRWETMGESNDQKPSGTLPPHYMMEFIELDALTSAKDIKQSKKKSKLKVIQNQSNLKVTGLTVGDNVTIFDVRGVKLNQFVARNTEHILNTPGAGLYIISSKGEVCKFRIP